MIRFGIIGPGGISRRFARVMATTECAKLVAIASSSPERAAAFAAQFDSPRIHQSYTALVNDPYVDAVYIGLTHNFHADVIRLCLEAGKPVLCEKPMVLHEADAQALADLSRERGVLLMEAMWTRCQPAFRRARQWIAEGAIGQPKLVQAAFCFQAAYDPQARLFNPALAGGALYDAGVYPIEFATGILGENPVETKGVLNIGPSGVDEYDAISLRFPSGAVAALSCGITARASSDATVWGTQGHVVVYDFLRTQKVERYDAAGALAETFEHKVDDGFVHEIEHFCELVREGKTESPLIPLADTIACAAVFDALLGK